MAVIRVRSNRSKCLKVQRTAPSKSEMQPCALNCRRKHVSEPIMKISESLKKYSL